ncbi:MAG: amino acid adenylation protein [Chloroflexota bacterium]
METAQGRIGIITLPCLDSNLYNDQDGLVQDIVDSLQMAKQIGAKSVSLTGLIPSATAYGKAVLQTIAHRSDLPSITTGHGTTSAAVVLNIARILQESGRFLETERVGFVGVGSIGLTTLRLILRCLPHPQKILLCDVYAKTEFLQQVELELVNEFGFQGEIQITPAKASLPAEIYTSTLIVGATNVPDVLDITQIQPGTLIVDDSGPHCFSVPLAIRRLQQQADILFTEGGVMQSPHPLKYTIHYPPYLAGRLSLAEFLEDFLLDSASVTGCVFSSLLSASFGLPSTTGIVEASDAIQHYQLLSDLGFQGSRLRCEGYVLPQETIAKFRDHFSENSLVR